MKLFLFWLAAGVLPVAGQNHPAAPAPAPITLYTNFQQQPNHAVLDAVQEEVESIMQPLGLHFEWRTLNNVTGHEVSAELAVVTFQGKCDPVDSIPHERFSGALGWTHVSDGEILPFTDIGCDRIHEFVQRSLLMLKPTERAIAYGRAVARVLAHELYHIFANTARHGAWGIAKESYTLQDLMSEQFQFQEKESRLLRANRPPTIAETESSGGTHY